jgi:hypothetical protein
MRSRNTFNYVLDTMALLATIGLVGTGMVVRWVLPPGSGGHGNGPGLALWGLGRHDWGDIHFWLAVATIGLLVGHVALHWRWVCFTTRRLVPAGNTPATALCHRRHHIYGAGFLLTTVLALAGFYLLAQASVQATWVNQSDEGASRSGRTAHVQVNQRESVKTAEELVRLSGPDERVHDNLGNSIHGSMTLQEVANKGHMAVDQLKELLGLPGDTPTDERMGRLGRRYRFTVSMVRELIQHHTEAGIAE